MNADRTLDRVAEAFSRKALVYDAFGQDHPNLTRMRELVYRELTASVRPNGRILELNAGTGADAAYLARLGFHVHATDIAPGMLAQISDKIERDGLEDRLTAQLCSFTELSELQEGGFDAILSNMGGLNCIEDVGVVARQMPRLLQEGGIVMWVIMPPYCLWDFAALLKGDRRTAGRRLSRHGARANVEGVEVLTYYHAPERVLRQFDERFRVERIQGMSVFAPPADRKAFALRYPRFYHLLVELDNRLAHRWPIRAWGDFYILKLRYLGKRETP